MALPNRSVQFRLVKIRAHRACLCWAMTATGAGSACGQEITVDYAAPLLDRWMYPFNSSPGYRAEASVFSAIGQENSFPPFSFDQRDGQFLLGFDTGAQIPTGRGRCGYRVLSATLTLTVSQDGAFACDPTYDAWTTYVPNTDSDPGRPVELYGAAFRNGWQACTNPEQFPCFYEGTPSNPGPPFGPSASSDVRNVFPTDFAGGALRDVSNNVRDQFDPAPFAIGRNAMLAPGSAVPVDTMLVFELDAASPEVRAYLHQSLDQGSTRLVVTSLQPATSDGGPGSGQFAAFYTKEAVIPEFAPRLSLRVLLIPPGDADGDGQVNFTDITTSLANWTASGPPGIAGDADCDGAVGFNDILEVLANFGAGTP